MKIVLRKMQLKRIDVVQCSGVRNMWDEFLAVFLLTKGLSILADNLVCNRPFVIKGTQSRSIS